MRPACDLRETEPQALLRRSATPGELQRGRWGLGLVDAIIYRVPEFVGVAPQSDDITLAVVTRGPG